MEVSKELEKTMANDARDIKSVEVVYANGKTVSGFVSSAEFIPLKVILSKHEVKKGENEYEYLDFIRATKITVVYNNGTSTVFE